MIKRERINNWRWWVAMPYAVVMIALIVAPTQLIKLIGIGFVSVGERLCKSSSAIDYACTDIFMSKRMIRWVFKEEDQQ